MALEVVGGAVLGAVIGELLKAVIDAKRKTSSFQPSLTRLESTLKSIIPRVDQISRLNFQLNHHPEMEEELVALINKGKALVLKCSKISTINLVRKLHYSKELQDLDNSLLRYFMTIMPLDHFKDTKEILVAVRELQMKLVGNQSESVAGTSKTGSILQVKEENGDEKLVGDDCLSSKSMVVVPVYRSSISPNGRLRQSIIKSWQKGDLLGSGSVVVDDVSSSWDICRSFSPQDDEYSNLDEEDKNFEEEKEDFFKEIAEREEELDDCLSSMVVPVYSILPNGKFRHSMKSWQKGDFLASWPLGAIYEGYNDDGLFFAVKELSLLDQGSQGQQSIHQLQQEISLLSQFEHENIVQYLGTDKDEGRLYIFLELVTKGSLASLYQKYILRDSQVSAYTRQILNGLKYLHERNVVHGDIKCAHILMNASGSVKLAHFGLAKATKLNDCKGTACWMAPEVVNRKKNGYGLAADIWSLGCTVLEMLTRQIPYSHLEGMEALFRIGKGDPPPVPNSLSRDAQDFIFKCLQANPDNRPTAAQLLEHSFVKRSLGDGDGVDGGL